MPVDTTCTRRASAVGTQAQEGVHHLGLPLNLLHDTSCHDFMLFNLCTCYQYIEPFLSKSIKSLTIRSQFHSI